MRPRSMHPRAHLASALAVLLVTVPAWAGDTDQDRATLQGVEALWGVVAPLGPEAERDGLATSQLQRDVDLRLRQAGIPVVPAAPCVLHVSVTTLRREIGLYAYAIEVAFLQPVRLVRNPTVVHQFAATWSRGEVGMVGAAQLATLRATVLDLVDQFINACLDKNPRKVTRHNPATTPTRGHA